MIKTLFSRLTGGAAKNDVDRRTDARIDQPDRFADLTWGGRHMQIRIINLSQQGLMAEAAFPPQAGEPVEVMLRGSIRASATVRWVRGERFGLQFSTALPFAALLSTPSHPAHRIPRAKRIKLDLPAMLHSGGASAPVRIRNISARGLMFEATLPPPAGPVVELRVEGLPSLRGHVRWSRAGRAGVMFGEPLSEAELHMFAGQR